MGCCFGREMNGSEYSDEVDQTSAKKPLYQEKIRWESDIPLTDGQLRSKRDEFWETAPAFEGRKEIWDALKGAATNAEQGDFALAQAIIDGANISLPNGILTDAYDELGNRYQIPIYCLYMPVNMIEDGSENSTTARPSTPDAAAGDMEASTSNRADIIDCEKRKKKLPGSTDFYSNDSEANNTNRQSKSSSPFLKFKPGKRNRDVQTSAVSSRDIKSVPSNTSHFDPVSLFFRLSHDSRDVAMQVRLNETVGTCKKRLCTQLECESPADQRWFFGGRQLPDRMRLCDCPGLNQENLVVQVIVPPTTTFDVEGQNSHLLDQNDVKARKEALKIAEQSASIEMTNTTSSSCHLSAKLKKGLPILQPSTPELNYDALPGVCITDTIATVTLVSSAEVVEHESDDTENETDTLLKKTGTISTLGIVEE